MAGTPTATKTSPGSGNEPMALGPIPGDTELSHLWVIVRRRGRVEAASHRFPHQSRSGVSPLSPTNPLNLPIKGNRSLPKPHRIFCGYPIPIPFPCQRARECPPGRGVRQPSGTLESAMISKAVTTHSRTPRIPKRKTAEDNRSSRCLLVCGSTLHETLLPPRIAPDNPQSFQ